ncbi:hypothetical protein [Agrobacterium radiobacter]|uniref:hypothetical protein n=1 Tax=Agrobacterium radiobacter TaxID=362 RepID=UPI003CF2D48A
MPNTIPAAGEAMPKTTRRAFLATVAVAALPVSAAASAAVTVIQTDQSALAALIDAYFKADAEADAASEVEGQFLDMPGRPDWPMVESREFSSYHYPLRSTDYYDRSSVEAVFDMEDGRIHKWLEFFSVDGDGNPALPTAENIAHRDKRLQRNDSERKALLAVYDARQKLWDDWSRESGHAAAREHADELDHVRCDLNDQVLAYPVTTFDEAMMKADFIDATYGGETRARLSANLVKEIAGLWRAKA